MAMEARLTTFIFCWLMALTYGSQHKLHSTDVDSMSFDTYPEQDADFFRLLLLSRYGLDSPDYTDSEQTPISDENLLSSSDVSKSMPFNSEENPMSLSANGVSLDKVNSENLMQLFRQSLKQYMQEEITTEVTLKEEMTKDPFTSTSTPDVLVSMPPVSPDKGQKEFVMLRPPMDNHRKIEHWMQAMANGMLGRDGFAKKKMGHVNIDN